MTSAFSTITNNVNLLLVDTSIITSNKPYVAYISSVSIPGRIATIRDATGYISSPGQQIIVSSTKGVLFNSDISSIAITKPFGFISLISRDKSTWNVINNYAFPGPEVAYVSSIYVNDGVIATNYTASKYISTPFINSSNISSFNISASNISSANGSITNLSSLNFQTSQFVANSGTFETLSTNTIYVSFVSSGVINASSIYTSFISTNSINTNSISTANILTNSISTINLNASTISTSRLFTPNISTFNIQTTNIQTSNIQTNTITTSSISTLNILTNSISTINLNASSISTVLLFVNTLSTTNLLLNSLSTNNFFASNISTNILTTNSVSTNNLRVNSIQTSNISSISLNTNNISANTISTSYIFANSISTINLRASTISTNLLFSRVISTSQLQTSSIILKSGTSPGYLRVSDDGNTLILNSSNVGSWVSNATSDLNMNSYSITNINTLKQSSNLAYLYFDASGDFQNNDLININNLGVFLINGLSMDYYNNLNWSQYQALANINLNSYNISNLNNIYLNEAFFSVPNTTDFSQFRYINSYFSYLNVGDIAYKPIASDWFHFPASSNVDMNLNQINNVQQTNIVTDAATNTVIPRFAYLYDAPTNTFNTGIVYGFTQVYNTTIEPISFTIPVETASIGTILQFNFQFTAKANSNFGKLYLYFTLSNNNLGIDCSGQAFGRLTPYIGNTYYDVVSVSYQDIFQLPMLTTSNNSFTLRLYVKSDSNATSFTSNYTAYTFQSVSILSY